MNTIDLLPPKLLNTPSGPALGVAITRHSPDVEMRAIWHPVVVVREGDDLTPLLRMNRPFTVVKATGAV